MTEKFDKAFETLTGHRPFPWQHRLYQRFASEEPHRNIPRVVSIPTGLGKTSVIAVWLIARAHGANVPRRLVYVVNRRTVVDQTTTEAEELRKAVECGKLPGIDQLAISTLRGQFADNGEWYADPSRPAVICGTVDMIGSRLLFHGYRIGFKSRPLHAGFLGQDALLIHDEAHLEPAFQSLIDTIRREQAGREKTARLPWPKLQVMALSATARAKWENAASHLSLESDDHAHPEIRKRTAAAKTLHLQPCGDEKKQLPDEIVARAQFHQESRDAVLVFSRRVDDSLAIFKQLETSHPGRVAPLTGTMRGHERDRLVRNNPVFARFLPESDRPSDVAPAQGTVYLVCTAAGEVGVNISADHMVCDLATFDSMAQRLGRVNRFGNCAGTRVDVLYPESFDDTDKLTAARRATLALLRKLSGDASPKALNDLLDSLAEKERDNAFAPTPAIPEATDIRFDVWAMTTIRGEMPGRPPVAPYLHGIAEWEPPRTAVAWREDVDVIGVELIERYGERFPAALFDDYPLKPHELLSDTSERVLEALQQLAKRHPHAKVWLLDKQSGVTVHPLAEIADPTATKKAEKERLKQVIADGTVLLPESVGGLAAGMLDGMAKEAADVADEWFEGEQRRRVRLWDDQRPPTGMALIRTIDTRPLDESGREGEEPSPDLPGRPRFWHWYARPADAEDPTPASLRPVTWLDHTDGVVQRTRQIATSLNLPADLQGALLLASEWHDLGKRRELWQRTIGNPDPTDWHAKPGKPEGEPRWTPRYISEYRHEFGSLLDVLDDRQPHLARLDALSLEMRDVVLHLIAAHHGYARPHFPPERAIDPDHPQSLADQASIDAMRRYARLQLRYGRWGLAYLESLLRAADWAASAAPGGTRAPRENSE